MNKPISFKSCLRLCTLLSLASFNLAKAQITETTLDEPQAPSISTTTPPSSANAEPLLAELVTQLRAKRERIRTWMPYCADGTQSHGYCPFADMTIFSGISCLAGETDRCEDVRKAQGPDGRWWRSPEVVGRDDMEATFSRDQAKGALAYLVATKDVQAALRWQAYLDRHDQKMCPDAGRCKISAGTSRLFGMTWDYLGIKKAKWMDRGEWISNVYDQIQAKVQPDGFPMHLNAVQAWIGMEIERRGGRKRDKVDQKVLKILVKREPDNAFFLLLRKGPTPEVAQIILDKCPDEKPLAKNDRLDWTWQRTQKDKPWLVSSGHDCIFIINVFERELMLRQLGIH